MTENRKDRPSLGAMAGRRRCLCRRSACMANTCAWCVSSCKTRRHCGVLFPPMCGKIRAFLLHTLHADDASHSLAQPDAMQPAY